jgi:hypothetical protein
MDQREKIGDLEEAVKSLVQTTLLETWTCLPGVIQSYDPVKKLCVVQPAIKLQTLTINPTPTTTESKTTPTTISMTPIPNVPLVFMGGGGLVLETTPQNGDECLLIFASRNIDGWWSKGGVQKQPIQRHHNLSDGFAIVGPWSTPRLFGSLGAGMRMRTVDGTAYIELLPTGVVNICAPGGVNIIGNLVVTGDVVADLTGSTFNGIPFATHVHTGVTTGGGSTGGPV